MVYVIINEKDYYEKLPGDPHKDIGQKYNNSLKKHHDLLTEKEVNYLQNFEVKSSQFYGLTKIHKSKTISERCKSANLSYVEVKDVIDLKLRPIVAGPSCLTHRLINLIDILLRPYANHVKSNLRDTTDFLNNLPERVPPHTILASFDIEALYSNIPHDLGLEAVKYWLEKYPEEKKRFLNNFILEAIKLILENNTFCFNNDLYKQIKGTAMGTKFVPVYATLSIGHQEVKLYEKVSEDFGNEFGKYFITSWKRFLDDCFILWTKSVRDLETLHNILNNLHIDINFTLQFSSFSEKPRWEKRDRHLLQRHRQ